MQLLHLWNDIKMDKAELLDREEILELTDLLKNKWDRIRNLIQQKNINTDSCLLVTYMEDEACVEFGILISEKGEVLKFTIKNDVILIEKEKDLQKIQQEFSQVKVGLKLISNN